MSLGTPGIDNSARSTGNGMYRRGGLAPSESLANTSIVWSAGVSGSRHNKRSGTLCTIAAAATKSPGQFCNAQAAFYVCGVGAFTLRMLLTEEQQQLERSAELQKALLVDPCRRSQIQPGLPVRIMTETKAATMGSALRAPALKRPEPKYALKLQTHCRLPVPAARSGWRLAKHRRYCR